MLDLKFIRENADLVKQGIAAKRATANVDAIVEWDEKRREIIREVESLKNERNIATKEIADLKKAKQNADDKIAEMKQVSDKIKDLDTELKAIEDNIEQEILRIPNLPHSSVPVGMTIEENVVVRQEGEILPSKSGLDHLEIAKKLGLFDFERGAKVTGGGFPFFTGKGAKLERALLNFFLDTHIDNGYYELMPPFVANQNSMRGTGQLPKMAEDMYHCTEDDLYLIPTAEVPLTNFYNDEILKGEDLPIKFCGYSPCFRREAGSYGKDVRGFLRVHQFNKVEMVKFTKPEDSFDELEKLTGDAENLLKLLGFTYRVLLLCSGDTSFASAKTYDLEVWAETEQKWLEVSSCSNFMDFQARRANIRFKRDSSSKPEFVHTLNGSGLATPRIIVALLEKYYDGEKLIIPKALRPYTGFEYIAE